MQVLVAVYMSAVWSLWQISCPKSYLSIRCLICLNWFVLLLSASSDISSASSDSLPAISLSLKASTWFSWAILLASIYNRRLVIHLSALVTFLLLCLPSTLNWASWTTDQASFRSRIDVSWLSSIVTLWCIGSLSRTKLNSGGKKYPEIVKIKIGVLIFI